MFHVVTYNILAPSYAKPDRYPRTAAEYLAAEPRLRAVEAQLQASAADVIALQEVEASQYEAILQALGPGFEGRYEARRGKPEGAAIYVRRERFSVAACEALHYAAHDPGDDQLALLVTLHGEDGPIGVANTHLRWQADTTPKEKHLGHAQLQELLDRVEAESAARWLVVGDFNATSDSEVLRGAYARGWEESCRSLRPWDTTNINGRCRKLDYLLYRTGQLVPEPTPLPRLERTTPMPSKEHPSDHLPVSVRYQTPKATRAPRRTATPNTESGPK